MSNIVINKTSFLDAPLTVDSLHGVTFTNENGAHKFVISCMQGGELKTLTGSVSARFMRANNTTILLSEGYASIEDGKAVVTLHQDCYNVPGRFQLAIFNTADNSTVCIYACVGTVQRSQNGDLIDSGDVVPSIDELLAQIEACQTATTAATNAASAANAAAESASTAGESKFVRYDAVQALTASQQAQARANIGASTGAVLYSETQTLTDTEKTTARGNVGAASAIDVDNLKSAFSETIGEKTGNIYDKTSIINGEYYKADGSFGQSSSWARVKIDIGEYDTITYSGLSSVGGDSVQSVWFDENDNCIGHFKQAIGENTIAIPDNTKYVGFSINSAVSVINGFSVVASKNGDIENRLTVAENSVAALQNTIGDGVLNPALTSADLEVGGIQDITGELVDKTDRVRTKKFLFIKSGTVIRKTGPNFNVWEYDRYTLECIANTAGWKSTYTVVNDCLIKMTWQTGDITLPNVTFSDTFSIIDNDVLNSAYIGDVAYAMSRKLTNDYTNKIATTKMYDLRAPNYVRQIAHRGLKGSGFAPESTEPAYILAYLYGYQGIEGDVRITSDGKYVIHHNAGMPSDDSIKIAEQTLDYLRENANMGSYNGTACEILTFEQFVELARRFGMDLYIDTGKITLTSQIMQDLYAIIKKYGMQDKAVWLISANEIALVRNVYNHARLGLMVGNTTITQAMIDAATDDKFETFVNPKYSLVTEEAVNAWREAGLGVQCWIADYGTEGLDTKAKRLAAISNVIAMGIDGITLDLYQPNTIYFDDMLSKWGIN